MKVKGALVTLGLSRPIELDGFRLTSTGVDVVGRPTYENYVGAFAFATRAHQASGFWLADLLRYGDTRSDWQERLSEAQHVTGLSEKRLKNIREVGAMPSSRRRETVEFALHEEVCRLPAEDQEHWLEQAETEGWTRAELRRQIRGASRATVLTGQAPTMHTVDVTVRIVVEAETAYAAEVRAQEVIKGATKGLARTHVIGAQAHRQAPARKSA